MDDDVVVTDPGDRDLLDGYEMLKRVEELLLRIVFLLFLLFLPPGARDNQFRPQIRLYLWTERFFSTFRPRWSPFLWTGNGLVGSNQVANCYRRLFLGRESVA